jgi:hypothetical protein
MASLTLLKEHHTRFNNPLTRHGAKRHEGDSFAAWDPGLRSRCTQTLQGGSEAQRDPPQASVSPISGRESPVIRSEPSRGIKTTANKPPEGRGRPFRDPPNVAVLDRSDMDVVRRRGMVLVVAERVLSEGRGQVLQSRICGVGHEPDPQLSPGFSRRTARLALEECTPKGSAISFMEKTPVRKARAIASRRS